MYRHMSASLFLLLLVVQAGDIVYLLDREGSDWYMGELNNKIGKFPNNFVKIILDLP